MSKLKTTITMELDDELMKESELTALDIANSIRLISHDCYDGFEMIRTDINDGDSLEDFYINTGKSMIGKIKIVNEQEMSDERKDELFDNLCNYVSECVSGSDLISTLINCIGFNKDELGEFEFDEDDWEEYDNCCQESDDNCN